MKRPFDQRQGGTTLIAATLLLGPCRCVILTGPETASNTSPWKIMRTQVCPSPVTFYSWTLILEFSSDADWTGYLNILCLSSWDFLWRKYPAISLPISSGPLPSVCSCPVSPLLADSAPSTRDTLCCHPQLAHEASSAWNMSFSQVLNEHLTYCYGPWLLWDPRFKPRATTWN